MDLVKEDINDFDYLSCPTTDKKILEFVKEHDGEVRLRYKMSLNELIESCNMEGMNTIFDNACVADNAHLLENLDYKAIQVDTYGDIIIEASATSDEFVKEMKKNE